jgi:hypothetical protein
MSTRSVLFFIVMAGLVPAIHDFAATDVDAQDKPGHDVLGSA